MNIRFQLLFVVSVHLLTFIDALAVTLPTETTSTTQNEKLVAATVELVGANGFNLAGKLELIQNTPNSPVMIKGSISNLTPGEHAFHVHTKGEIGNNCADAGKHFNPKMMNHGSPNSTKRHVGDLGNIISTNKAEETSITIIDSMISLQEDDDFSILNRAVVIHEKKDDFSGPKGNAGKRIACGIIVQKTLNNTGNTRCNPKTWPKFDFECCSVDHPCGPGEGDCDTDNDCIGDLTCGHSNCGHEFPTNRSDCCEYQNSPTIFPIH